jgi:nitrogen fixation/metabolism regulation signal transduction histidine kinase
MQTTGEMKTLVDSFNKMAARLKEQKEGLEKAYNDLRACGKITCQIVGCRV